MSRRVLMLLLAVLPSIAPTVAWAEEVETTAIGTGADENDALADALAKATAQVLGVQSGLEVRTGRQVVEGRQTIGSGPDAQEARFRTEAGQTANAVMRTQGRITRFNVESTETLPDGRVRVAVRAWVHRPKPPPAYQAPGTAASKPRVAVSAVDAPLPRYQFFGEVGGFDLAQRVLSAIEAALMRSGKVAVVDRQTLNASLAELNLLDSRYGNAAERSRLKQLRGVDLLLQIAVREADAAVRQELVKTTGQVKTFVDVSLLADVRGIVPATTEVIVSTSVAVNDASTREQAFDRLAEEIAEQVVAVLTRSKPTVAQRRAEPPPEPTPTVEDTQPRRSGIRLRTDRQR